MRLGPDFSGQLLRAQGGFRGRRAGKRDSQVASIHPGAGAWLNEGQVLESRGDPASLQQAVKAYEHALALLRGEDPRAVEAARCALQLVAPPVASQPVFVDLDLKARRALMMALGRQLHRFGSSSQVTTVMTAKVSDAIDDGMALVRRWTPEAGHVFLALEFRRFPVRSADETEALKQVETLRELRGTLHWLEEQTNPGAVRAPS